jgi:UDPglucose 6-dehydrogenase
MGAEGQHPAKRRQNSELPKCQRGHCGRTRVRIVVLGLWHLGSVTAAALAALGHQVVGVDFDEARIAKLLKGTAPIFEPDLDELIDLGLTSGNLRFSSTLSDETSDVDVLWVAFDTPIEKDDSADAESLIVQIAALLPGISADTLILISSQLPVGSVRRLERILAMNRGTILPSMAYIPENLRLGKAVSDFLHPDRIVAGFRTARDKEILQALLGSITKSIEWMSVESAEMTKHAINSFLGTSIVFANEIAAICETVGADAKQVERGLKTDHRIGPRAYLSPGAAFAGGTLARDVAYLNRTSHDRGLSTPLLSSILTSNDYHKSWAQRTLQKRFGNLSQIIVAVWGLAYKPGTDTLRRSMSIDLCDWLIGEGATVRVHDSLVTALPAYWYGTVTRYDDPIAALDGAHALVIATDTLLYRGMSAAQLIQGHGRLVMLDANRYLFDVAAADSRIDYHAVGMPLRES